MNKNILLTASLPLLSAAVLAQDKQPNLVFIMADQWRGDAVGYNGTEPVQTPHLDKLSAEGITFMNAVSGTPVSSPARAMLMTGMYPHKNGVTSNCNSATAPYGVEMATDARCWSDVLKDKGYDLAYLGKWHLDSPYKPYIDTYNNRGEVAWNEWCPPERRHGFRHWIAYGTYDYHLKPMYWKADAPRDNFYYVDQWGPEYEADEAIKYIDPKNGLRPADKPFAIVVSMNPPHTGYELVPERYKELYKDMDVEKLADQFPNIPPKGTEMGDYFRNNIQNYYACMTGVDENAGRIVDALKANGLFENTIVVFTSDHGIQMGAHNETGKNVYYEESMRIPLIVSYPEKLKPRRSNLNIAFADLYPTLLSLMGFQKDIPAEVQTFDLSKMLLDSKNEKAIAQPYYFVDIANHKTGYRGLRTMQHTFVVHATDGKLDKVVLFDREADPFQLNNIAEQHPKQVKRFKKQLAEWLKKTEDPFIAAF